MKYGRSILAPVLVMAIALVSGGWFLQRGSTAGDNVYMQMRLFQEVFDRIQATYVDPVDRESMYDAAIAGMIENLGDPHSSLIDAETWESFRLRSGADAEYGGVGLEILKQNGWITVITPLPGGPAKRMGIRTGDLIVEVGGQSTEGWETDKAADELKGTPGTQVEIAIRRPGVDQPIPFTITRAVIELLSVPFSTVLEDGVGYLPLQVFGETSTTEIRSALSEMADRGMTGLVLDLRDNPGGLLEQGVAISDLFLERGDPVVATKGRAPGQTEAFSAVQGQIAADLPVVVLVNESSASASEIVAGALQDHDRAVVVGGRSYGKGSVQTLTRLTGGDILRLTTAKWFTPSGRSIQKDYDEQYSAQLGRGSSVALDGSRVERPNFDDLPTYQSMAGREIYGGGGIYPDLTVLQDTLTAEELASVRSIYEAAGGFRTELFDFAVTYVQGHSGLRPGFTLSDAEVRAFQARIEAAGLGVDVSDLQTADRFIRYQLEREIALQAWGEKGQFEQTWKRDQQLLAAVALLRGGASSSGIVNIASEVVEQGGPVTDASRVTAVVGSN